MQYQKKWTWEKAVLKKARQEARRNKSKLSAIIDQYKVTKLYGLQGHRCAITGWNMAIPEDDIEHGTTLDKWAGGSASWGELCSFPVLTRIDKTKDYTNMNVMLISSSIYAFYMKLANGDYHQMRALCEDILQNNFTVYDLTSARDKKNDIQCVPVC